MTEEFAFIAGLAVPIAPRRVVVTRVVELGEAFLPDTHHGALARHFNFPVVFAAVHAAPGDGRSAGR